MNNLEFALHFAEHIGTGLLYGAVCLAVTLLAWRRYFYSIFDPLLFYAVLSAMGGSVVLYLFHHDLIRTEYLVSYLATQAAFLLAFRVLRPAMPTPVHGAHTRRAPYDGAVVVLYPLATTTFAVSQAYVYSVSGLPILLDSRLETFSTGGGYGLFSRLLLVSSTVALSCAAYRIALVKRRLLARLADVLVLVLCIAVAVMSGSKGALLNMVFTISLTLFFASRFVETEEAERRMRRFLLLVVLLAFPVAFATVYLQAGIDNPFELASVIAMRFFQTGEIYFMVYPGDVLDRLPEANGLLALLYAPLGSLRLVDREALPTNLGLLAFWYHYDTALLAGPNARHNVFGLHYFGPWLSIAFSFLLGMMLSVARNGLYRFLPGTPIAMIVYVLVVSCAVFIEQDVAGQAIEYLFSVALFFPVLLVVSTLVAPGRLRRAGRATRLRGSTGWSGAH